MKRVGIFGGTFDPIHFGHLHLAVSLSEAHHLDEVWWVPAAANPLKKDSPEDARHRLAMLQLALEGLSKFKIVDCEIKRPGPSYTVDTLRALKDEFGKDIAFHLLLGEDSLSSFSKWKEAEEVLKLASPLIGSRQGTTFPEGLALPKEMLTALKKGWTPGPVVQISATDVRKRLKESRFCGHLVPWKVLDYIFKNRLYFSEQVGPNE